MHIRSPDSGLVAKHCFANIARLKTVKVSKTQAPFLLRYTQFQPCKLMHLLLLIITPPKSSHLISDCFADSFGQFRY